MTDDKESPVTEAREALERLEDEIDLADTLAALREPGRVSWDELKAELKL